jgi:formate-dependent nitrite reductase membrane component NrfD
MSNWEPTGLLALTSAPPFGWWIAAYFALAAMASGLILRASLPCLIGSDGGSAVGLGKACLWALVALGFGGFCLVADLASPKDFLLTLTHFNPNSWISIGSRILCVFAALCLAGLAFSPGKDSPSDKPGRVLPLLLINAALALAIYPALVLMQATGRPLWDSALLPAIFLASAFHLGVSLGPLLCGLSPVKGIGRVIAGIELALVAAFVATKSELLLAEGTWLIWAAAYIACSFVLPAFMSGSDERRPSASAWLVLVGTFILRFWLLEAGQSSDAFLS